jgi:pteridine reductase
LQIIDYLLAMNQNALITGASKRIGRSMAEHLASRGWNVVIHHNGSVTEAFQLISSLSEKYPQQAFTAVKANLANKEESEKLVSAVAKESGIFQLLINNASVFDPGTIESTTLELMESQININFLAPFILSRDFRKLCKTGNIINLVDTRITSNKTNFAAYSMSKKALWELTKMSALEFAPDIRVNAIAPGVTLQSVHEDEGSLQRMALQTPMKKPGGVAPILKSLDFILDNEHLTGQLIFADGGENLGKNS